MKEKRKKGRRLGASDATDKTRVRRREIIIDFLGEPQVRSRSTWMLQDGGADEISAATSLANSESCLNVVFFPPR